MGIGADIIEVMAELRLAGLVRRKTAIIEIGAQQLENSFLSASDQLQRLGFLFGISNPLVLPVAKPTHIAHGDLRHLDAEAPAAREFWRWLGFEYAAIDIDGSPGNIALDLNFDSIPAEAGNRYGLVTNFGTTEHVANQLNAFKVIHDLTAPNGLMYHRLPAQGMFNHGLINYNYKFFWMLARSNNYKFIFAEYAQGAPYELPGNIVDFVFSITGSKPAGAGSLAAADSAICVVMQKTLAIPFVPPLDVPTGARTDIEALKRRYWSVFDPGELARLADQAAQTESPGREQAIKPIRHCKN
jgi:hypothetical protein